MDGAIKQAAITPVRAKSVRLPPYALARWLQKWHGLCVLCGESVANQHTPNELMCATCHAMLSWRLPPVRLDIDKHRSASDGSVHGMHLYFATYYQYPINHALNHFKDDENLSAFMILLHAIRQLPKPIGTHADNAVIIPVPTTPRRLARRGFDPVILLAKSLAYHWQIPLWQGLYRIDDADHQRGLARTARLDNIRDAFVMADLPPARRVILFDDVVTTGATIQAAARTIIHHAPNVRMLAVCVAHGTQDFSQLGMGA